MVRIANVLILLAFVVAVSLAAPSFAASKSKKKSSSAENDKYASIVIDSETGAILSQTNPDKVLHPASLTKMMTLMLTFEALEAGRLRPSDRITISKRAASQSPSKLGLKAGQTIRVQDAIYAVVTKSANDISVALAEAVGGSEPAFVQVMNLRAQSIGMNRTRFRNASGLPDPRQVSTARDMAKLGRHIITQHAAYYPVFNKREFVYGGRTYHNHNRLMDSYAGMDGMKTGFVNASGFNLVASAKRNNQRLIAVVFGGKTTQSRNMHMAALLDKGFVDLDRVQIANAQRRETIQQTAAIPATTSGTENIVAFQGNTLTTADRLIETGPQVATIVQTTTTTTRTTQQRPQPQAVQLASLATANDAQPVAVPAPLYVPQQPRQNAAVTPLPSGYASEGTWSIQVGAYQSRVATDQAIYKAMHLLPGELSSHATPMIVPLRTADATWVFRARLSGFNQHQAEQACARLKDCLTISPQAY